MTLADNRWPMTMFDETNSEPGSGVPGYNIWAARIARQFSKTFRLKARNELVSRDAEKASLDEIHKEEAYGFMELSTLRSP